MRRLIMMMGAVACMMLFVTAQPAAAVVYTYDFDRGDEGWIAATLPVGHDGWYKAYDFDVSGGQMLSSGGPGSGWYYMSVVAGSQSWGDVFGEAPVIRDNDAAWSYSIGSVTRFDLEFDMQGGYVSPGWGQGTRNHFGLAMGGEVQLSFGGNTGWITDPARYGISTGVGIGDPWQSSTEYTYDNQLHHVKLEVDMAGVHGSSGTGTMYVDGVPEPGLIDVDLGLTSSPADWDGIFMNVNSYTRLDNLKITVQSAVIPEPAGLGLVGIAVLALRRRRA